LPPLKDLQAFNYSLFRIRKGYIGYELFTKSTIILHAVKSTKKLWYIAVFLFCILQNTAFRAQNISGVINKYAKVLDIDTCLNEILVENTSGFSVGDRVMIIQMKGAEIDLSNSPSFGSVTNYANSGNYEFGNIAEINGLSITLKNKIVRLYTAPQGFVQLVRVPQYGDVTVTGTVTADKWDGFKGGIIVFEASGKVNLNADIDVSSKGFLGGLRIQNGAAIYDLKNYFYYLQSDSAGNKGEGIATASPIYGAGRGAIANGGGGGNGQNAGGGGGANGGVGGIGGDQGTTATYSRLANGGLGGINIINSSLATNKVFLGGGGGAGQQNDNQGSAGGNGGGIVIIRGNTLVGGGGKIIADGENALDAQADGAGGGGGGGTIVLDVNTIQNNPQIFARGGNGGNNKAINPSNQNWCFAPGGGGSGGIVVTKGPSVPPSNLNGGKAGIVTEPSLPCYNTTYGATAGANGGGIWNNIITDGSVLFTYPRIAKSRDTICEGNYAQLDLSGAHGFKWIPNIGLDNDQIANPKASPTSTTRYTVTYLDDRNCAFADTVLVIVNPRPKPQIAGSFDVCSDQTFFYTISTFPGATYNWNVNGGNIITGQGTEALAVKWGTGASGYLTVDVTASGTSCFGKDSVAVTISPVVTPKILGDSVVCSGDTIILTASPASFSKYLWSNGDTTASISLASSGKYYLTTTMPGGCITYSDTVNITVHALPVVTIIPTAPIMADTGGIDTLYLSSGFTSKLWNNGKTTDTIFITDSGTYSVQVTDSNGCPAKAEMYIPRDIHPPAITLSIDSMEAAPCDMITIPLKIDSAYNLEQSGATDYITEITFDQSLLSPMDKSNYVIHGRWGILTLYGTRAGSQTQGVLRALQFGVGLGDTVATIIRIETFTFTNGKKVKISTHDGLFKLSKICLEGGARLFAETDSLLLMQNVPNPAHNQTRITYRLIEEGISKLWISDMLGRNVATLLDQDVKAGLYSVELDISKLSDGNYFYILQTPTTMRRRMMRIQK
jgi:hypothetical protein